MKKNYSIYFEILEIQHRRPESQGKVSQAVVHAPSQGGQGHDKLEHVVVVEVPQGSGQIAAEGGTQERAP